MSIENRCCSNRAIHIIADYKMRAAIEAGAFDNFPGFGKPIAWIDDRYDLY